MTGALLTGLVTALLVLAQAGRRSRRAAQQARRHLQSLVEFSSDAMDDADGMRLALVEASGWD